MPPRPPGAAAPPGIAEGALAEVEVRFIADEVTNAVIVATFPRNWPDIEDTLKKLDRMPRQVLIEVLLGLIKNSRTLTRSGIPLLNRLPLLGLLFGSTEEKIEKTELLILITPRVLGTALDAARLTEEMKRITPGIRDAIRLAPRPPSPPPPPPAPQSPSPPGPSPSP